MLGPCLNASGRLDTAKRALALLEAGAKQEADVLAGDLKALNDSRKEMTEEAVRQAAEQVEHTEAGRQKVLVLYLRTAMRALRGSWRAGSGRDTAGRSLSSPTAEKWQKGQDAPLRPTTCMKR